MSVQALEPRRLFTGGIQGVVSNDLTGVWADLGTTPLANWRVFVDVDRDGQADPGEQSAVTDLSGRYAFTGMGAGRHTVAALDPAGWSAPSLAVDVSDGAVATANLSARMTEPTRVDVMIAYTPAARAAAGGDAAVREDIAQHVRDANRVLANSDTNVVIQPVLVELVSYTERGTLRDDLMALSGTSDGAIDQLHARRNAAYADLVVLYVDRKNPAGEIGIGYVYAEGNSFDNSGFAVVTHEDGSLPEDKKSFVLAHELSHNLGAGHDAANDQPMVGKPPYAHGIVRTIGGQAYNDIMAYGAARTLPILSSPDFIWKGTAMGDASTADNARVVRESAPTVAGNRSNPNPPPVVTPPPPAPNPEPGPDPDPGPVPTPPPPAPTPPPVVTDPPVVQPPTTDPPATPAPQPTGTDLKASKVTGPKAITAGGNPVAFSARIVNRGANVFQGKVRVEFFLSRDGVLDDGDVLIKRLTKGKLKITAGKFATVATSAPIAKSVAGGKYFLLARIDGNAAIAEDDEANNVAARADAVQVVGTLLSRRKQTFHRSRT